jgi:predicted ATPase/class 3 adenylate cyclase
MALQAPPHVVTYLFTDIEGSTRLWEQEPERMRPALERHDAIARAAVEGNGGVVVKITGDGIHAAFEDPMGAIGATLQLQQALDDPDATDAVPLRVRCGLHVGVDERRDNDFFGRAVNRAARIMSVAHGGQVLLSQAVAVLVGDRLPEGVALRDLGSVRLRDLASPERLYQIVHPNLQEHFPALRTLEATPNNLAQQVTSFVGRERELSEIKKLLTTSRLVTLVGAGGIGKTRLSLQVAADVLDEYPDGVWLVELAHVSDGRLLPQVVAFVLGVRDRPGRPMVETLAQHVADRKLLIILDNCEHMLQACAELARRGLQAAPKLKILASSREHLHVAGEATYSVPALALPDASATVPLETLSQYEALRLFVERATAAQPSFQMTSRNAAIITEICRRLDGIPLAIELAAARVRALSVEQIAARLGDRFRLLAGGDRTSLPRQQTLRALIDWSYDLLDEEEKAFLRRVAVFAGGWTLEAAEAVGAGGQLTEPEVIDVLSRLVEKSLVVLDAEGGRYRLLETVRQYAQERLEESGERNEVCGRHLAFYLAFGEKARSQMFGPEQATWLARIDLERENLLAAHAWCENAQNGAELDLKLVHALKAYWLTRGLLGLGRRIVVEALERPGAQQRTLARAAGLFDVGQNCSFMGRYEEARTHLEESLSIARELDDKERVAAVLQPLAMVCVGQGDSATARRHLEEALELARKLGDKREIAAALNALGQVHRVDGKLDEAEPLYEDVLSLARELNDGESIAIALLNLAMVSIGRDAIPRARAALFDVLALNQKIGSKPVGQSVLEVSAGLAAARGEWENAARFFGVAEAQAAQTGLHRDPTDEAFLAPLIAKARSALGTDAFNDAESRGRLLSYEDAMAEAQASLDAKA